METKTKFGQFNAEMKEKYELEVLTIKVRCKCGATWGIRIEDYDSFDHIPLRRFMCLECMNNVSHKE